MQSPWKEDCKNRIMMMKKNILPLIASLSLAFISCTLAAQNVKRAATSKPAAFAATVPDLNMIRHNYKYNQYTYTGSERLLVTAGKGNPHPFYVKLDLVGFPDGSDAYLMELDFVSRTSVNIPKDVKMTVMSSSGKIMSSKQMSSETTDKHAFTADDGSKVFWNKAKYLFFAEDMNRMAAGVKHIDVATGWGPDEYVSISFENDELGQALKKELSAIKSVKRPVQEIGDNIAQYADRFGSTTIVSKPIRLEGKRFSFNVSLNYLYYKDTNKEDYDLNFTIKGKRDYDIPVDSPVIFELADGTLMNLKQEKDDRNAVHCYPTVNQVKVLARGVRSLQVETSDGIVKEVFAAGEFSKLLDKQYNSLQTVSPL